MKELIKEIQSQNIDIRLNAGELELSFDGDISPQLIQKIRESKQDLIQLLSKYAFDTSKNNIEATAERDNYPLSYAQKTMWSINEIFKQPEAYNLPFTFLIEDVIDVERLNAAFNKVIARHETLRTVFRKDENREIKQWILPLDTIQFSIDQYDFRQEENALAKVNEIIAEDIKILFNLEEFPLLTAKLFQIANEKYVLYYKIHHIISDAWSMDILFNDVMTYYRSENTLTPLAIQYKDYTLWQIDQLQSEKYKADKAFWLEKLSGELPVLKLPFAKKQTLVISNKGETLQTYIPKDAALAFKALLQQSGTTLFMGFLACAKILIHRYTNLNDIMVGSPVAGRNHTDLENQIGCYINIIAHRNQINSADTFKSILANIKEATLEIFEHQEYPFDHLMETLNINRAGSQNLLFDIMLVLQNARNGSVEMQKVQSDSEIIKLANSDASKFDLSFSFSEFPDQSICFRLEYNTDIYDEVSMKRLMQHYKQLLNALLVNPEIPVGAINYLSKKEEVELVESFNATQTEYTEGATILDAFKNSVANKSEAIALEFENTKVSYAELARRSNQFAQYLQQEHHVNSGDYVALHLGRSEHVFIAILGTLKTGAAFVPIAINYPAERKAFIIKDTDAKVCIDEAMISDFISKTNTLETKEVSTAIKESDTAYIIYTSGTTGNPKGVMISHGALHNYIQYAGNKYMKKSMFKFMLFTSLSFDLTITTLFTPICHGGIIKIMPSKEHDLQVIDMIEKDDFDIVKLTPAHVEALLDVLKTKEAKYTGSLKGFIIGGETLKREVVDNIFEYFGDSVTIWNEYGPTEATVGCIVKEVEKETNHSFVSIGKPMPNVQAYILDTTQRIVPIGVEGEMYLGGKQLTKGYLNKAELTVEKFIQNPFNVSERLYRTGDKARWMPNGDIVYLGREDSQIKIRGYRVELEEITKMLSTLEEVQKAVVTVATHTKEKILVAYIVSAHKIETEEIRVKLLKVLPDYMIPNVFIQLEELPLNTHGKLDKKQLPHPIMQNVAKEEYEAPTTRMENELTAIWQETLGLEKIGRNDNVIQLGAHSLKLLRLKNEYHKRYDVFVEYRELYKLDTIKNTATYIEYIISQQTVDAADMYELDI